jgi:thiol-disulfide isomerase/thioredoxin
MRIATVALLCASLAGALVAADVPRPSPEFSVTMPGAKPLPVRTMRGKVVLLAFISTTCPHCQQLTQALGPISQEYAAKGVQIVVSAFNDGITEKMLKEFVDQYHPGFPVGMNSRAEVMSYLQYSVLSQTPLYVPHLVFIDRTGVIRADYPGESPFVANAAPNVRAELNKMLAASPVRSGAGKKAFAPKK